MATPEDRLDLSSIERKEFPLSIEEQLRGLSSPIQSVGADHGPKIAEDQGDDQALRLDLIHVVTPEEALFSGKSAAEIRRMLEKLEAEKRAIEKRIFAGQIALSNTQRTEGIQNTLSESSRDFSRKNDTQRYGNLNVPGSINSYLSQIHSTDPWR